MKSINRGVDPGQSLVQAGLVGADSVTPTAGLISPTAGLISKLGLALLLFGGLMVGHARAQESASAGFDTVLSQPDNVAVNTQFLQAQLANGDFQGAAVTLQRLLLIDPDFDQIRLVRAAVLLRLGDDAGAAADLAYLDGRPLSQADRAEASRLAARVRSRSDAARLSGMIRFGGLYDSNPGQAPGSGSVSSGAFSFAEDGRFGAFGEVLFLGQLPFGGGAGHEVRIEGRVFARAYDDGTDGQSYAQLAAGPRFDLGFAFFDLMALGSLDFLGGDVSASRLGGRAQVTVDVSDRVSAALRVELVHDAVNVDLQTRGNPGDGDGLEISARPSLTFQVSDAWQIEAHAYAAMKDAGDDWYSYDAFGGGASTSYRMANGVFVRLSAALQSVSYDAANPLLANDPARQDTRWQLGLTGAVPLTTLARAMGQTDTGWADGWSAETFIGYYHTQSNVDVYDADSWTIGLSFTRHFSM